MDSTTRAVVVIDRGWIFAGDITRENGRIKISRAVWVYTWVGSIFSEVIENPNKAKLKPMADMDLPESSEMFSVPVSADWGL